MPPFFIIRKGANFLFVGGCAEFLRSYYGVAPKVTGFGVIFGAKYFNNWIVHFFGKSGVFRNNDFNTV